MTQRERFVKYMKFEPVDRVPLMEMGVWSQTFERWHKEGLPESVNNLRDLEKHLNLDISFNLNWLPINSGAYPVADDTILEETQNEQIIKSGIGEIRRVFKDGGSMPQFIRFAVENEKDYEKLRPLLNGKDPKRYPPDFDQDFERRRQHGEIIGVNFAAFFGWPRGLMGLENWCMAFYDQPELAERIIRDHVQFGKDLLARVLATGAVDFVQIWEDMAFKTASLISPDIVRRFMQPAYEEFFAFLRQNGVKIIMIDCDGHVGELLPIYLEAGADGLHPCEIAAGSDPVELRRSNPGCALMGGMDKRLIASGHEGVDAELRRIQPLLKEGGYIPFLDHFVPPDVPFETYTYYVECRRALLSNPGLKL